jgi:hypothetical protein
MIATRKPIKFQGFSLHLPKAIALVKTVNGTRAFPLFPTMKLSMIFGELQISCIKNQFLKEE